MSLSNTIYFKNKVWNWLENVVKILLLEICFKTSQVALVVKHLPANAGGAWDTGSVPWLGKSPGSKKSESTPIFLPGKFHGQRSLVGYSVWSHKELDITEWLSTLRRLRVNHKFKAYFNIKLSKMANTVTAKYFNSPFKC